MKESKGFTLLEMICVVFLLGLMGSMVIGSLPDPNKEIAREHEKIIFALRKTAERAQLEGKIFGLRILTGGWEIQVLSRRVEKSDDRKSGDLIPGYRWQTAKRGLLKMHYRLPEQVELTIDVDGVSHSSAEPGDIPHPPQILFLPGGEVTDFTLSLSSRETAGEEREANSVFTFSRADLLLSEGRTQ
ncbi:type II secretion system minor pseudopilin GspH [Erwinia typographi]|uniref:type II secretion system minor pseudopilin GspH n=1 Tax=Erwinia typographi TaxID=371042 RepID=UPI000689D129|nr:type II secretion system minor pseudopilin GspH [Erwinia typographi]